MNLLLWLYVAIGALMVLGAVPLIRRRVKPNIWYGLRTRTTLADESIWYEANVECGRHLAWLGALLIVAAVVLRITGIGALGYGLIGSGIAFVGAIIVAVIGSLNAERLRRSKGERR